MKKIKKKMLIFAFFMLMLIIVFFVSVNHIQQKQKIDIDKVEVKKSLSDYKSGEVITMEKVYEEAGASEVSYLAVKAWSDFGIASSEAEKEIYYVDETELVQQVMNIVNETEFEVCNVEQDEVSEKMKFCLWLGVSDEESIVINIYETQWEGVSQCDFAFMKAAKLTLASEDAEEFLIDYHFNGFFIPDKLEQVLTEIMKTKIKTLTLEEARAFVAREEGPVWTDFQQYYYEESYHETYSLLEQRYELADYEGYLTVLHQNDEQDLYTIEAVWLNNDKEELQEILYQTKYFLELQK